MPTRSEILGVVEGNTLKQTRSRTKGNLGQTDIDEYDEVTPSGEVVARHKVTNHTDIKGFQTTHMYETFDLQGNLVRSHTIDPFSKST